MVVSGAVMIFTSNARKKSAMTVPVLFECEQAGEELDKDIDGLIRGRIAPAAAAIQRIQALHGHFGHILCSEGQVGRGLRLRPQGFDQTGGAALPGHCPAVRTQTSIRDARQRSLCILVGGAQTTIAFFASVIDSTSVPSNRFSPKHGQAKIGQRAVFGA